MVDFISRIVAGRRKKENGLGCGRYEISGSEGCSIFLARLFATLLKYSLNDSAASLWSLKCYRQKTYDLVALY